MKLLTKLKRQLRKQTTGISLARNWLILISLVLLGGVYAKLPTPPIVTPIVEAREPAPRVSEMPKEKEVNYSDLIEKYAFKYAPSKIKALHLISILHCLAWEESWYNENKKCGDDNRACGPWQIWQGTWIRLRKEMMEQGLITEIGSRLNPDQSTETTVWAITHGKQFEWGPIKDKKCDSY